MIQAINPQVRFLRTRSFTKLVVSQKKFIPYNVRGVDAMKLIIVNTTFTFHFKINFDEALKNALGILVTTNPCEDLSFTVDQNGSFKVA